MAEKKKQKGASPDKKKKKKAPKVHHPIDISTVPAVALRIGKDVDYDTEQARLQIELVRCV